MINTLIEIIDTLIDMEQAAKDSYVKCAISDAILKYSEELENQKKQNAKRIVEYRIKNLVDKLNEDYLK